MSVIMAEFGRTAGSQTQLSKHLAPFINKAEGSQVKLSDFGTGASANSGPEASGGTIQDKNGYRHHIFTSSNTEFCIDLSRVGEAADQTTIHLLAQAGGGGEWDRVALTPEKSVSLAPEEVAVVRPSALAPSLIPRSATR